MSKPPSLVLPALLAMSILMAPPATAQSRNVDQTIPLKPGGLLRLEATKGSVRLTSWDRPDVQVRARIDADADRSELDFRDLSGELRLEIDRGGNSRIERVAGSVAIEWSVPGVPGARCLNRAPRTEHLEPL